MKAIDLNSDLGEGLPPETDAELLGMVSSANVACGGHAGDATTMRATIRAALDNGVRIGAHPSYPDREGFGRARLEISGAALAESLAGQVQDLIEAAASEGGRVAYIKPHGALYNDAVAGYRDVTGIVCELASDLDLPLMTLPGSAVLRSGSCATIMEGFLDRGYRADGTLVPRSEPGALITTPEGVRAQARALAPRVDSLSLHSDTPGAVALMREGKWELEASGFTIAAG